MEVQKYHIDGYDVTIKSCPRPLLTHNSERNLFARWEFEEGKLKLIELTTDAKYEAAATQYSNNTVVATMFWRFNSEEKSGCTKIGPFTNQSLFALTMETAETGMLKSTELYVVDSMKDVKSLVREHLKEDIRDSCCYCDFTDSEKEEHVEKLLYELEETRDAHISHCVNDFFFKLVSVTIK